MSICCKQVFLNVDRELMVSKMKLESNIAAQRSAMHEKRNQVEVLENVLAKQHQHQKIYEPPVNTNVLCNWFMLLTWKVNFQYITKLPKLFKFLEWKLRTVTFAHFFQTLYAFGVWLPVFSIRSSVSSFESKLMVLNGYAVHRIFKRIWITAPLIFDLSWELNACKSENLFFLLSVWRIKSWIN